MDPTYNVDDELLESLEYFIDQKPKKVNFLGHHILLGDKNP